MSQVQWLATSATLAIMLMLVAPSAIDVRFGEFNLNALFGIVFGAVAFTYTYLRFDLKAAGLCDAVAQLCIFVIVGGAASYVAAHYGAWSDFRDGNLLAIDRAFGLDWRAYLRLVAGHPAVAHLLDATYRSLLWQVALLIVVLTATGGWARLQTFVLAFQFSALACVTVSALVPALGAYPYLHISAAIDHPGLALTTMDLHVGTLLELRGAAPILPIGSIEGIVTFPSLHTALAILFAWGFWSVPVVRWGALGVNLLMIASTPLSGGHYFTDLAGGALVALAALAAATAVRRRLERTSAARQAGLRPMATGAALPTAG